MLPQFIRLVQHNPPHRDLSYLTSGTFLENLRNGSFLELFFMSTTSVVFLTLILCLIACVCCRKNCLLPVCQAVCKCLCKPWSFLRQKTSRRNNSLNILPSNNMALQPMSTSAKRRLKRRAPSPPAGFFRSLLPKKDNEPTILVNARLSPSTSRRFLDYIHTEPQPTRRLRSRDRRFEEL